MDRVLDWEQPDLVVYSGGRLCIMQRVQLSSPLAPPRALPYTTLHTSSLVLLLDQVTGENVGSNATAYWAKALQPCLDTDTPWATVFGNHGE